MVMNPIVESAKKHQLNKQKPVNIWKLGHTDLPKTLAVDNFQRGLHWTLRFSATATMTATHTWRIIPVSKWLIIP